MVDELINFRDAITPSQRQHILFSRPSASHIVGTLHRPHNNDFKLHFHEALFHRPTFGHPACFVAYEWIPSRYCDLPVEEASNVGVPDNTFATLERGECICRLGRYSSAMPYYART
jgi:hypothetical protein